MIQNTTAMRPMTAVTPSPPRTFDRNKALAPVAKLLDMSVDELNRALKDGKTLDKIAASKGVAHTDLVAAIKEGLQDSQPSGKAAGELDKVAEDLASGKGHRAHHHHGPPPAANRADTGALATVSSMLDMSSSDLVDALTSGTSLVDLALQHGVSSESLLLAAGRGMVLNTVA